MKPTHSSKKKSNSSAEFFSRSWGVQEFDEGRKFDEVIDNTNRKIFRNFNIYHRQVGTVRIDSYSAGPMA